MTTSASFAGRARRSRLAPAADGDVVTSVALFPPTTVYDYEARLALGVAP